ncbi:MULTISPECIES: DUF2789 family protein [unclassified Acinetobacter]|uniref:DUF2789 family protein n=1 Tax=unclassified Acinetobacter TaxID=196816 RepID=UPI00288147D4|nr:MULTISPECIES: DUF2789 family protein [unclassified Acinetobacter]MDT0200158.1 DUF2789 family protein [Acinetobacter sp. RG5]MDT0231592.1 DUF2789 family protein [Acinetobacter sp. RRD8]
MTQTRPRMTKLFEQLGLASTEEAIAKFIESHQLSGDVFLTQAIFWTDAQRHFLEEKLHSDGEWTTVIDQLNESLHENSVK